MAYTPPITYGEYTLRDKFLQYKNGLTDPLSISSDELINLTNSLMSSDYASIKISLDVFAKLNMYEYAFVICFVFSSYHFLHGLQRQPTSVSNEPHTLNTERAWRRNIHSNQLIPYGDHVIYTTCNTLNQHIKIDFNNPQIVDQNLLNLECIIHNSDLWKKFEKSYIDHTKIKFKREINVK